MWILGLTWNYISETDGGHCDKTKIECVKEGPVLEMGEDGAAKAQEDCQESESHEGHHNIGANTHWSQRIFFLLVSFNQPIFCWQFKKS